MKTKRNVLYIYTNKENREFIENMATEFNETRSYVINVMIECAKENKRINLQKNIPMFVKKAEAWKESQA